NPQRLEQVVCEHATAGPAYLTNQRPRVGFIPPRTVIDDDGSAVRERGDSSPSSRLAKSIVAIPQFELLLLGAISENAAQVGKVFERIRSGGRTDQRVTTGKHAVGENSAIDVLMRAQARDPGDQRAAIGERNGLRFLLPSP